MSVIATAFLKHIKEKIKKEVYKHIFMDGRVDFALSKLFDLFVA
jgi:hypothetical protein